MNKKGFDLFAPNTIQAILFVLMLVSSGLIVRNWWLLYQSKGSTAAIKTLDNLKQAVDKLDPEYSGVARIVPVQTNEFIIKGYSDPDICAHLNEAEYCICVCRETSCEKAYDNPEKFCRPVLYNSRAITIGRTDEVTNYVVRINNNMYEMALG